MITKLETARELARAIWSSPDALWNGHEDFQKMLRDQGNEITPTGSVRIGDRLYKISKIFAETKYGEKREYSKL